MKIKLTKQQIKEIAENPDSKVEVGDPGWIIVLKVIAYLAGLLLAGYGTAQAATNIMVFG